MLISIKLIETVSTETIKSPIQINTDNYPELNNMSLNEIHEYINNNSTNMQSFNGYLSLYDELFEQSIILDDINNEIKNIFIE